MLERNDPVPAWSGKNSRRSLRISRGGALHRKGKRNCRVVPPFPESPRYLVHSRETCFSCTVLSFKPRIDSHHDGPWDSPVGKSREKPSWENSRESHRSLDPSKGKRDKLLQLGRKAHVHAPTRDEDFLPWGDSRNPPISMSALEWNPQVPATTPHKVLGPGIDGRGIPRGPRATPMGTGLF